MQQVKPFATGAYIILFVASFAAGTSVVAADKSAQQRMMQHVEWLADDAREGRGIGTAGLDSAANYIERHFQQAGLKPLFANGFKQSFEMNWGVDPDPGSILTNKLDTLRLGKDFQVVGFTGSGEVSSTLHFVGYGITAPEYDYDDYSGQDVKDRIVLVLTGEPAEENPGSRFEGERATQHMELRNKAINAKTHDAAAVIFLDGDPGNADQLPILDRNEPYADVGIPVVHCTITGLRKFVPELRPYKAKRSIDLNEAPRSMTVASESPLHISVHVTRDSVPVANIGGVLPGTGEEIIVLGAHYDHLGYGQQGSTVPGVHEIHNGADDNASGVAVLLEAATQLAGKRQEATIWFVSFTGEETGLVGSSWFVNHPPAQFEKVKFMLNLDMVGRMQNNGLTAYGVKSAEELHLIAEEAAAGMELNLALTGDGYGPSDQTSFYAAGIPVLQLFTAAHFDYHSPGDDADKINGSGLQKVLDYSLALLEKISSKTVPLTYSTSTAPTPSKRHGNRPSFGSIPDFAQPDSLQGVRLQGVRPGGPAALAGLQSGDVLLRMGDVIIDNIYDFVFALDASQPGDSVLVEYQREGRLHQATAVLTSSSAKNRHGSSTRGGSGHPMEK